METTRKRELFLCEKDVFIRKKALCLWKQPAEWYHCNAHEIELQGGKDSYDALSL